MRVAIRSVEGRYIGMEPNTPLVYQDRDKQGEWEVMELTFLPNGVQVGLVLVAAGKQFSVDPAGKLDSRVTGKIGPWETFYATTQPEGNNFLYQIYADCLNIFRLESV